VAVHCARAAHVRSELVVGAAVSYCSCATHVVRVAHTRSDEA
jgi:hypothetical protein